MLEVKPVDATAIGALGQVFATDAAAKDCWCAAGEVGTARRSRSWWQDRGRGSRGPFVPRRTRVAMPLRTTASGCRGRTGARLVSGQRVD